MATVTRDVPIAGTADAPVGTLEHLIPSDLKPWPGLNPRTHFDPAKLAELEASVREHGVLEPLLVHRRAGDDWSQPLIVAGERRWRAAAAAGLKSVPCIVREIREAEALEIAMVENLDRDGLTFLEEVRGYRRWIDLTGGSTRACAAKFGRAQPTIANGLRLLELPPAMLALVEEGILAPAHARDLVLPFLKLREDLRWAFLGQLAERLRKARHKGASGPLGGSAVKSEVMGAAVAVSRPISRQHANWQDVKPLFEEAKHAECTCGGPKMEYTYSAAYPRCFDLRWWEAEQEMVRAAQLAEEQARAARIEGGAPAVAVRHYASHVELAAAYDYSERTELVEHVLLDPERLAGAKFVTFGPSRAPVCVEPKKAKAAQQAAARELRKRLRARQQELEAGFLERARATTAVDGSLLRFLLNRAHDRRDLAGAAKPLGLELSTYAREDELATVPDAQLVPFAKLLQLRVESGAWREYQNPEEERIRKALEKEYRSGLDTLLAGIRGTPPAEAEEVASPSNSESAPEGDAKSRGARARRREKKEAGSQPPTGTEANGGLGIPPEQAIGAPHGPRAAEVVHA
jgi:ParB/RepB/Spo0J family partition protein